jgi:hypothetical protein
VQYVTTMGTSFGNCLWWYAFSNSFRDMAPSIIDTFRSGNVRQSTRTTSDEAKYSFNKVSLERAGTSENLDW